MMIITFSCIYFHLTLNTPAVMIFSHFYICVNLALKLGWNYQLKIHLGGNVVKCFAICRIYISKTREGSFKKKHSCGFIFFKTVLYTHILNRHIFH